MTDSLRDTVNIRIKPQDRGLIDRAASLLGKTRTGFVLETARQAAANVVLDWTIFALNPKAFAEFLAHVDGPSGPKELCAEASRHRRRGTEGAAFAPPGNRDPPDSFGYD